MFGVDFAADTMLCSVCVCVCWVYLMQLGVTCQLEHKQDCGTMISHLQRAIEIGLEKILSQAVWS
jgi:hypothetical protein